MSQLTGTWLNNHTDKYATIQSEPLWSVYILRYHEKEIYQRWSEAELLRHWSYVGDEEE